MAIRRTLNCATALCLCGIAFHMACAQSFSEWNQATGVKSIEYRWKPSEARGCDVEYRNNKPKDKKKYKARLVFQIDEDEKDVPNAVVSFADGTGVATDHIPACTMVTDISVTRF